MSDTSSTNLSHVRGRQDLSDSPQHDYSQSWPLRSTDSTTEQTGLVREITGLPVREEIVEAVSDESISLSQETVAASPEKHPSRPWKPGLSGNLPWGFILALFGTVAWFGCCVGVIFAADKSKADSWAVAPTVILAILGPLASMMLQYELSCGLVITWWNSALSGTTLGTLHRQWDHGTSTWAASISGRGMDKIALAKLMATFVFAVNPLLQRALITSLTTEREDVRLSTAAATDMQSFLEMNFLGAHRDASYNPIQLSPSMSQVMQQFNERQAIKGAISGCTGNCSGVLAAAGIDFQCSTIRNTSFAVSYGHGPNTSSTTNHDVFRTGTNVMNYHTKADFNLTIFYVETDLDEDDDSVYDELKSCYGVSTTINCVLQHAVVAYPFTQRDGVIIPETQGARVHTIRTEPRLSSSHMAADNRDPVFGGLSLAAYSLFNSSGTLENRGKYGWESYMSGPLTAPYPQGYLVRGANRKTCDVAFSDPSENIISKLNEIMFRIALAAPNPSSPRNEFVAQQQTVFIIYESRYVYLWGALAITVLAVAAVVRTASGFHNLGRPVSLSPIEISIAFGFELLRKPNTSNMDIKELMGVYQDTRVEYASIDSSSAEAAPGDPRKRLQLCLPGNGLKPRARELFTG